MRASLNIPTGVFADRRTANLQLAWIDAADDAHEAYLAWRDAEAADESLAFVVYRAALDREETAARALEQVCRERR
ncbi:MAG TPA: hypothetical protein VMU39_27590 [Solirubrobacteraceae bacterium]|nr:hypothetical protein [Solirubrobacteraceae bacterium]